MIAIRTRAERVPTMRRTTDDRRTHIVTSLRIKTPVIVAAGAHTGLSEEPK